jgi:hypothetical protein
VSDQLIAAIIVVSGAILAPFLVHLLTRYREGRAHLGATVSVNDIYIPQSLSAHVNKDLYKPPMEPATSRQFDMLIHSRGYICLIIHNRSKRRINAIAVRLTASLPDFLHQVEGEMDLHGPNENTIHVGDLQPRQSRTVHIWATVSMTDWLPSALKALFDITADEFEKQTLKLPPPIYIKHHITNRVGNFIFSAFFGLAMALIALMIYAQYRYPQP